nr:thioredoxin family protein [Microbacterium pseudoresistens]
MRDGRRRRIHPDRAVTVRADDLAPAALAPRATLVQFSTEFCTRCPQVRRVLADWTAPIEGVSAVEIDLTRRTDLASRYGILATPTVFLVDEDGVVRSRFHGIPARTALDEALADLSASAPDAADERSSVSERFSVSEGAS